MIRNYVNPPNQGFSFDTIASVRTANLKGYPNGAVVAASGYTAPNDGGGGSYYIDTADTTTPDDGGITLVSGDGVRVKMIHNNIFNVKRFGANGANTGDQLTAFNATVAAAIANASSWLKGSVYVPSGRYRISSTWVVSGVLRLYGDSPGPDGQASQIFLTDNTGIPAVQFTAASNGAQTVENLTVNIITSSTVRATSVNAAGLELLGYVYNSLFRNLSFNEVGVGILHKGASSTSLYSNTFENIYVNGFGYSGMRFAAYGTQNTLINCNIRNYPVNTAEQSAVGTISNVGAVVTISGLGSTFTNALTVGQLITVSGSSVSTYNGYHTLLSASAGTITYQLSSVPGSGATGSATVSNNVGVCLGEPFYSVADIAWLSGNVETVKTTTSLFSVSGTSYIGQLHLEAFVQTGNSTLVTNNGTLAIGVLDAINGTIASGLTCYILGPERAIVNEFIVRDLYYSGSTLTWSSNVTGTKTSPILQIQQATTLRWNRTSSLSTPPQFEWYIGTPAATGVGSFKLTASATVDRRMELGPNAIQIWDNGTGATPNSLSLQGSGSVARIGGGAAGTGLQVGGLTGSIVSKLTFGTGTLVAGTAVVSQTNVTSSSRIFTCSNADGGTPGWLRVTAKSAGVSFTVTSSSGTDTSTFTYLIIEP